VIPWEESAVSLCDWPRLLARYLSCANIIPESLSLLSGGVFYIAADDEVFKSNLACLSVYISGLH
jgi:hypothetical protein